MDLSVICIVATSAYPQGLATLSPFLLVYLPTASAVPPELPPTWRSHTICGSYVTFLLTDGLPSTLLTFLRLVRSEELHSCISQTLRD